MTVGPKHTTIRARVAAEIRAAIADGSLQPGERILTQEWAARLKVSGTPVREALATLASDGLVDLVPHVGAVVRRHETADLEYSEMIQTLLDGLVGELAATRLSDDAREGLARSLDGINGQLCSAIERDDVAGVSRLNRAFMQGLYAALESRLLLDVRRRLYVDFFTGGDVLFSSSSELLTHRDAMLQVVREHDRLVRALESGDAQAARDALSRRAATVRPAITSAALRTGQEAAPQAPAKRVARTGAMQRSRHAG